MPNQNNTASQSTPRNGTLRGPFRMRISDRAEQLDFEMLPDEERNVLAKGIRFDPERYEVHRFFVVLETMLEAPDHGIFSNWSRRLKRQSLVQADRVLIRVTLGSQEIGLIGIYPNTRDIYGQHALDLEGEALLSVNIGVFKLSLAGKAKDQLRRRKLAVWASRTDSTAEWVFLKPYIESGEPFQLQFCCLVPKSLADKGRYMRCETTIEAGKRVLESQRKKVRFTRQ